MKFPTVSFLDFFNGLSLDFQGIDFVERGWCFVQIQHSKTSLGPLVEVATCSLFLMPFLFFYEKHGVIFGLSIDPLDTSNKKSAWKITWLCFCWKKTLVKIQVFQAYISIFTTNPPTGFPTGGRKFHQPEAGGRGRVSLLASDVTWAPWVPCCWPPGWFKWAQKLHETMGEIYNSNVTPAITRDPSCRFDL